MQKKSYKIAINWIQEPTLGTKLKVAAQIYGKTFVIGEVRSPFQDGVQAMQKKDRHEILYLLSQAKEMAEKILSDDQTEAVVKKVHLVLPDSF